VIVAKQINSDIFAFAFEKARFNKENLTILKRVFVYANDKSISPKGKKDNRTEK